ncbi:hypothetical protein V7793_05960, partial [Streptomyces sp. KLMMK]
TRAVFLTYEAESLIASGAIDQAAHTAHQALTMARQIGAPRCIELIHGLVPSFTGRRAVEGVPELLELTRASCSSALGREARHGYGRTGRGAVVKQGVRLAVEHGGGRGDQGAGEERENRAGRVL